MNTKLFLIIVLIYSITYSQVQVIDDDPNLDAKPELYFWNYTDQDQDLSLELLSTGYTFGYFGEPELAVAEPCSVCGGGLVTHDGSSSDNGSIGWDIISVYNPNGGGQNNRDFFGWGLYKVFHPLSNQYFYLDFRDCGFDRFYPPGSSPDSHIKLLADGELTYAYTDNITPRSVENGERVKIWEEWGYSEPDYSDFPSDFWENSLGLDRTNNNLVLLWIPRPNTSNITGYKIYRAFSPFYETTPDTDFYEIASTSININIFTDQALVPDTYSDRNNVYYKVEVITPSQSYITEFVQVGFSATTDWNSALICIKSGDHPYLTWAQYHRNDYVSGYKVYKKKNSSNYQLLATTTDLDYLDTSEYIYDGGGNKTYASYYVKAELTSGSLSPASNTVSAAVEDVGQVEKMTVTNNNEYEISLSNYPNPFNPETAINYSIPKSSLVNITVYDLLGRKIAELINEIKEAGSYEVNFNAENHPSGLYIYKLTANENIITKKMMLLR